MVYLRCNLWIVTGSKIRLEHAVAVYKTWFNLNCHRHVSGEKMALFCRESRIGGSVEYVHIYNVMVVLVMDIRGICYYKILLEK